MNCNRIALLAGLCVSLAAVPGAAQQSAGDNRFAGYWAGVLRVPNGQLRLAIDVTRSPSGALAASLISLDQGNAVVPGTIAIRGDSMIVAMAAITYTAAISAAGDSLRGIFRQGASLPLDLGRATRPAAPAPPARPQEPKPPFPYAMQDVTFESVPGVRLAGTITRPAGNGPFPAVVMVTGSGAQDRNEELLGHKPFLVIADYLARHGIAALRYDDRGFAKSTGNFAASTTADFANDAEAAVKFLRAQPGIAPNKVGIIGHSEGGEIAPIVAARSKDVAFIVLLAGPGIPGDSILLLQEAMIAAAAGTPSALIQRSTDANRRLFAELKAARDSTDAAARLSAVSRRMVETLSPDERALGTSQLAVAQEQLLAPWMRYFIRLDPRPALRQVHVPVLALNGTLDLQVPYREDLAAIDTALMQAGNKNVRVVPMPGLNHLFQTAKTGSPSEYASIPETFSPAALELIASWIRMASNSGQVFNR
jgi:uncharacterized protein